VLAPNEFDIYKNLKISCLSRDRINKETPWNPEERYRRANKKVTPKYCLKNIFDMWSLMPMLFDLATKIACKREIYKLKHINKT